MLNSGLIGVHAILEVSWFSLKKFASSLVRNRKWNFLSGPTIPDQLYILNIYLQS